MDIYLIQLDGEDFTKVVAGEIIGRYEGLH